VRDNAGIGFRGGKTNYLEGQKVEEKSPPGVLIGRMPQGPIAQREEKQAPVESSQDSNLYEKGGQHSNMAESGGNDIAKKQQKKPAEVSTGTNDVTVGTDNTLDKNSNSETEVFEHAEEDIRKAMEEDPNFDEYKDNVIVTQTPEGMKIEIIDDDKLPMFEAKGAQITQAGEKILHLMSGIIKTMPNRVSITGHTEATNYAEPGSLYTNWELTSDRANAARRFLMTTNLEPTRIAKVVGRADQELLDDKIPTSPRNRRVTLVLLRGSYLKTLDSQSPAPQNLLTVPRPTPTIAEPAPPAPKPAPPPKAAKKPEVTPATRAQKTNVDSLSTDFKMPDSLRQSLNGGQKPGPGNDTVIPQSLLTPPQPVNREATPPPAPPPPTPKPRAMPRATAPMPPADSLSLPATTDKSGALSTEFKMPDALKKSINGASGTTPHTDNSAGGKANGGLNSLPSGLIKENDQ
jgi:chemotaxis protein MotB